VSVSGRRITTTVTIAVLFVVLAAMAVYGFKAATAPLPDSGTTAKNPCSQDEKQVKKFLRRGDVQVSVFNAGDRSGFAGTTLEKIEDAGFKGGNAGNAPENARVRRAVVWTTKPDDPAARLVALALGARTRVVVTRTDLGPGIDVLVGNRFNKLDRAAAKRVRLTQPVETCIQVD
jgi:hypothetical protein